LGTTICGKNLIINKLLYRLKTSVARFHEHLAESLLRLGFKKTKHDSDIWMIDKTSHYEYLATYIDDILIWSKDPMAVIKSLRKQDWRYSYVLFGWKCDVPRRFMEEPRFRISYHCQNLYQECHP
jgi:hypothetical protein